MDGPPRDEAGGTEEPGLWVTALRDTEMRGPGSQCRPSRWSRQHETMKGPTRRWPFSFDPMEVLSGMYKVSGKSSFLPKIVGDMSPSST